MEQDGVKINLDCTGTKKQLIYLYKTISIYIHDKIEIKALCCLRTACKMHQKIVKQLWNIKPKLAVCSKTAVRSQMIKSRKCFFGPNLPKNGFQFRNFENLSPDSESSLPRYYVCQFSGKMNCFDFCSPNLPKNRFRAGISKI